jgi:hypothetical protein
MFSFTPAAGPFREAQTSFLETILQALCGPDEAALWVMPSQGMTTAIRGGRQIQWIDADRLTVTT